MALIEKSYSGKIFRPRPEIHIEPNGELLIIATPWGQRQSAKRAIQILQDFFLTARQDVEVTSPFEYMSCLSHLANTVRIGIKLVNESIFNEENKHEFTSGLELFVLAHTQNEVVWAQIGYPFVFLDRPQRPLMPLGSQQDLSVEFSVGPHSLSPLPHRLVGIDTQLNIAVDSIKPRQHDRFIFISRSGVPAHLGTLSPAERDLNIISKMLADDDADLPFWLGLYDLNASAYAETPPA